MISKICTAAVFVLIFTQTCFALGIGEWKAETPFGNIIYHDRESDITSFNDRFGDLKVDSLNEWYFYKKHAIGSTLTGKYFVVDENTLAVNIFNNKNEWNDYLAKVNLKPTVWVRWHGEDWTFSKEDFFAALLIELFIGLFITGIIVLLKYLKRNVLKQSIKLKQLAFRSLMIYVGLPFAVTIINYVLSLYPVSF